MPSLKYFPLNDGNKIPTIAFGTGSALFQQDVTGYATEALQAGLTHLDSAQMYGNEVSLGRAIAKFNDRSKIYVTTKLGQLLNGESIKDSLVRSCKELQVDYVDLFLIHSSKILSGRTIAEAWAEMEALKEGGLAKSIGVSNFRVQDLEELISKAKVIPAVNQIEYHAYTAKSAEPILEYHKKHNIITESYGGLTPIVRKAGGPVDPVVASIRKRLTESSGKNVTDGQVLLKWLEAKEIVAVTTTSKKERLQEYLGALDLPGLTPEEVKEIDDAGTGIHHRQYGAFMGHMDRND